MQIYDISQEVFTSAVYPGDPSPEKETLLSVDRGDVCNLTAIRMCAHNGTHVDAPYHFFAKGETVDRIPLDAVVGPAYVAVCEGELDAQSARAILHRAASNDPEAKKRILLKGSTVVTQEAASVFAEEGVSLVGNESQTVGPENAPMQVHLTLLGAGVTLLEGIRLQHVPEGVYHLSAAPLSLGGADGAPCRAYLIDFEK